MRYYDWYTHAFFARRHSHLALALVPHVRGGYMIEAGSFIGSSAIAWSRAIEADGHDSVVVCIDTWAGDANMWRWKGRWLAQGADGQPRLYEQFMLNVKGSGVHTRVVPMRTSAAVGLRYVRQLVAQRALGRPALVYLDAAHEFAETQEELHLAWALLPAGGFLVGDDYSINWPGVVRAVDTFVADMPGDSFDSPESFACAWPFAAVLQVKRAPNGARLLLDETQWVVRKRSTQPPQRGASREARRADEEQPSQQRWNRGPPPACHFAALPSTPPPERMSRAAWCGFRFERGRPLVPMLEPNASARFRLCPRGATFVSAAEHSKRSSRSTSRSRPARRLSDLGSPSNTSTSSAHAAFPPCRTHEVRLRSILVELLQTGVVPGDSVLEAGSHDGLDALCYAAIAPERTVHAIDPVASNIVNLRRKLPSYPTLAANVWPYQAALGARSGHVALGRTQGGMAQDLQLRELMNESAAGTTAVHSVDGLFALMWPRERLGLAQLDLEGSELAVLRGATRVLQRDQPVLALELHVLKEPQATLDLMGTLASLGYRTLVVDEVCGVRSDCRNILALPLSRSRSFASLVDRALATGVLRTMAGAASFASAVTPCCARGVACAHPLIGFPDAAGVCCEVGRAHGTRLQPAERPRSRDLPPCNATKNYTMAPVARADRFRALPPA